MVRFLIRKDYTFLQFQAIVRHKLSLEPSEVLFFLFPSGRIYGGGRLALQSG